MNVRLLSTVLVAFLVASCPSQFRGMELFQGKRSQKQTGAMRSNLAVMGDSTGAKQPEWFQTADVIVAAKQRLRSTLSLQVAMDFEAVPLSEVVRTLCSELGAQVEIDLVALEELGIEEDLPITISGEGTVRDLFRRMLHPLELTYRVNESTIEITSQEEADENPAVRLYDLSYVQSTMDLDAIHNAIMQTIDPDSWPMGGGGIYFVGSMLVIAAPEERQLKVQMLLSKLSKMNPQNQVSVSNY